VYYSVKLKKKSFQLAYIVTTVCC